MVKPSGKNETPATWLRALILVAAAFWIYAPVLHGNWLWDDEYYITLNPLAHDPARLWKTWFVPGSVDNYFPFTATVQWVQWLLWGDDTFGYHLTNVVLHIAGSLLVWRLLSRFNLRLASLGGLIFAIHPVQVESVAWISELKNTLSLPPFLLAMIFWIDYEERGRRRDYFMALGLFLPAMLCKTTVIMFPLVILLYAWWKRGRVGWGDLKAATPFLVISLALGIVTVMTETWFNQLHPMEKRVIPVEGLPARVACGGLSLAFYFSKCFLPVHLMTVYPHWRVDPPSPAEFLPWPILAGVVYWLWTKRRGWGRHALLGLGFFLINLAPFAGFNPRGVLWITWVMDHFLYLPIIGLIGLFVAGLGRLSELLPRWARFCGAGIILMGAALLTFESRGYAKLYCDGVTLWKHTLQQNPEAGLAGNNYFLGTSLYRAGRVAEAIDQFEQGLQFKPGDAADRIALGRALAKLGRYAEAVEQFSRALKIAPDNAEALAGRGELKRCLGDPKGALADLDQASALEPGSPQPWLSRGVLKLAQGDAPDALSDLRRFRQLAPQEPNADYALLWIWNIRAEQNEKADADRELSAALSTDWNAAAGDWATENARFLLGQIDETEYLAAAVSAAKNKDQGQLCEAWYYAGMKRLLAGDKTAAAADFRACLATGKTGFFEYTLAQGQLDGLGAR